MDSAIGRVLDELDQLELTDDTLVIFTSDNGGFGGVADNRPLRAAAFQARLAAWRRASNAAMPVAREP